jgi:5-methylcytosine-specific restriction endonuclease McrA
MDAAPDMRTCTGCGAAKARSEYSLHQSRGRIGKPRARCKACDVVASALRRSEKPEACNAASRRWQAKNPEKVRAYARAAYHRNAAARCAKVAKYQKSHAAALHAWRALYRGRAAVKDKHAAKMRRRNAALREIEVPQSYLDALFAAFDGLCAYCKAAPAKTLDHVQPISNGGKHEIGNLLPACNPCNASKHARDARTWGAKRGVDVDRLLHVVSTCGRGAA